MTSECQNPASCSGVWKWSLLTEKLLISVALSGHVCKHSCTTCSIVNKKMKSEKKLFLKESTLSFTLQWFWVEFDCCEQLGIGIDSSFSELCRVLRKPQQIANSWMCSQPTWLTIKSTKNISTSSKFLSKPLWIKNLTPLCRIS